MNWAAVFFIIIGAAIIIVGWQGTQGKIANVLWGAQLHPFGPAAGCPPGFGEGTCGAGMCEIDTVTGRHCIPAASTNATQASNPGNIVTSQSPLNLVSL